jgi:hypothetical protein
MKLTTMVVAAMVAAMEAQAGSPKSELDARVTVFTYNRAGVPGDVVARAKWAATAAFAMAGIEVRWVEGKRLGEPREVAGGEVRTVVFDGPAMAGVTSQALAFTNLGGGADADVHVFYNRVAGFAKFYWSGAHLSELLGNVLAHELTHALEGVARHSSEGLMKATWSGREYAQMVDRHPLAFAAVDRELLRAHFQKETRPTPTLAAAR